MAEEIELASPEDIAARRALWLIEHPDRERGTGWKKWQYTDEHQQELQRIATDYQRSERKRKTVRMSRTERAAHGPNRTFSLREKEEENERWERIFKEKIEDKDYYTRGPEEAWKRRRA